MYLTLWHYLPGNSWVKIVECVLLLVMVVLLLMTVVFPWVEARYFTESAVVS